MKPDEAEKTLDCINRFINVLFNDEHKKEESGKSNKTGLECLQDELIKRGCTSSQAKSKVVAVVLDILANTGDMEPFKKEWDLKEQFKRLEIEKFNTDARNTARESELKQKNLRLDERYYQLSNDAKRFEDEKKKFVEDLESCETPEMKDRIRIARWYRESVKVETKYDNTAFIIGLGAILAGTTIDPIKELRKVNEKI